MQRTEAAASGAALLAPAAALADEPDNTINPTDAIVQAGFRESTTPSIQLMPFPWGLRRADDFDEF